MREVVRSNDPVRLSFLTALLAESGIEAVMMDLHASIMEGSIGALERRLMVLDEDYERARALLEEAGEDW
ncbi:DUF2007 domain-containing protein [Marivibrio halodurans]|uniref:DUF2007 domain-containing protein n=1 Tax=Marivibrio halodurans TaxID=2039722 RepID=A0A8J7V1C4_9PROT|nr:DUF2007 domain-containing protein [Marivibrio halodurans]